MLKSDRTPWPRARHRGDARSSKHALPRLTERVSSGVLRKSDRLCASVAGSAAINSRACPKRISILLPTSTHSTSNNPKPQYHVGRLPHTRARAWRGRAVSYSQWHRFSAHGARIMTPSYGSPASLARSTPGASAHLCLRTGSAPAAGSTPTRPTSPRSTSGGTARHGAGRRSTSRTRRTARAS
jgi:hypothetical protein